MIPPQTLHYVGLALARVAGWGAARLTVAGMDRAGDLAEFRRLSRLDQRSLLIEIAGRDNAQVELDKPDDLVQQGQATVDRLLPKARALICPHRDTVDKVLDSPEFIVAATVAGYLAGGLPGALVNPVASLLAKRGIPLLCGKSSEVLRD